MSDFEKLIGAAKQGAEEVVRAVIQGHPELINKKDEVGAIALHYAAFAGYRLVVKLLVQRRRGNQHCGQSVRRHSVNGRSSNIPGVLPCRRTRRWFFPTSPPSSTPS